MNDKVLNYFDDAYYINLDRRTDRRDHMESKLSSLDIKAKRFPAITVDPEDIPEALKKELNSCHDRDRDYFPKYINCKAGEVGCALSHKAIIRKAKEEGLNNILIFEDDCLFLDAWREEINILVKELSNIKWDIIYFGGELTGRAKPISDTLAITESGIYCTHAYAVNKTFFDEIINFDINWCWIIDLFLVNYNKKHRNFLVSKKMLTSQESGYSDLRGNLTNNNIQLIEEKWNSNIN
jgi:GR25 family glycosyltransferase involved in LPS biosynthesis